MQEDTRIYILVRAEKFLHLVRCCSRILYQFAVGVYKRLREDRCPKPLCVCVCSSSRSFAAAQDRVLHPPMRVCSPFHGESLEKRIPPCAGAGGFPFICQGKGRGTLEEGERASRRVPIDISLHIASLAGDVSSSHCRSL